MRRGRFEPTGRAGRPWPRREAPERSTRSLVIPDGDLYSLEFSRPEVMRGQGGKAATDSEMEVRS